MELLRCWKDNLIHDIFCRAADSPPPNLGASCHLKQFTASKVVLWNVYKCPHMIRSMSVWRCIWIYLCLYFGRFLPEILALKYQFVFYNNFISFTWLLVRNPQTFPPKRCDFLAFFAYWFVKWNLWQIRSSSKFPNYLTRQCYATIRKSIRKILSFFHKAYGFVEALTF